jgi:hypothetical protein
MFDKSLITDSSPPTLDVAPWRELVVDLDEQTEELLSGGSRLPISAPGGNIIVLTLPLSLIVGSPTLSS